MTFSLRPIAHCARLVARALFSLLAAAFLCVSSPARAQAGSGGESAAPAIHWAFGSFMGTGAYRLSDERGAFVLKIPARWTFSRAAIGQDGERRIGLELRFPLTLGVLRSSSIADYIDQETSGTVSFTPGVEVEIPLTQDLSIRPFFAVGWGAELGPARQTDESETALIYQAGLKSRYRLPVDVGMWAVLGAVQYAG